MIVPPGDDEVGRLGIGAAEGGLTPLLLVREAAEGDGCSRYPTRWAACRRAGRACRRRYAGGEPGRVAPGDRVAVLGCGPIGLLAIATLADRGIHDVVAVDLSRRRLELANSSARRTWWIPTRSTSGRSSSRFTAPYRSCSGRRPPPTSSLRPPVQTAARRRPAHGRVGGRLLIVALHYRPVPTNFVQVLMKQFTIRGSFEYPPTVRGRHRAPGAARSV